jgi:CheY-like chemotaxis protein
MSNAVGYGEARCTVLGAVILVVDDVEETLNGLESLLRADGYRVDPARDEQEAVRRAKRGSPDLILMSLGRPLSEMIAAAARIRLCAELNPRVPIVFFCIETLPEGAELEVDRNVYGTRPDNFNQLRRFLIRLLHKTSRAF